MLCVHWSLLECALSGDGTHNLGLLGRHSSQLSKDHLSFAADLASVPSILARYGDSLCLNAPLASKKIKIWCLTPALVCMHIIQTSKQFRPFFPFLFFRTGQYIERFYFGSLGYGVALRRPLSQCCPLEVTDAAAHTKT